MLAALAVSFVIARSQTIDFEHPAAPAPVVIAALGEQIGLDLTASKRLERSVLILHLRDVDQEDVLARIAEVLHAEWREDGGKLILSRSDRADRELRQRDLDSLGAVMRPVYESVPQAKDLTLAEITEVARLISEAASGRDLTPAESERIDQASPARQLVIRLGAIIDHRIFALNPSGARYGYRFNAQAHDDALPAGVMELARQFDQETATMRTEFARLGITSEQLGLRSRLFAVDPIVPGEFMVETWSFNGWPDLEYLRCHIGDQTLIDGLQSIAKFVRPPLFSPPEEWRVPVELSELSAAFASLQGDIGELRSEPTPVPAVLTDALISDRLDPMNLIVYDLLVLAAETSDLDLIAVVPDWAVTAAHQMFARKRETLSEAYRLVFRPTTCSTRLQDGFLIVQPLYPWMSEHQHIDRGLFVQYLDSGFRNEVRSVDLLARILDEASLADYTDVDSWTRGIFQMPSVITEKDRLALRIYSALSDGGRVRARTGGLAVDWRDLTPETRAELEADLWRLRKTGSSPTVFVRASGRQSLYAAEAKDDYVGNVQEVEPGGLATLAASREIGHWLWESMDSFTLAPTQSIEVVLSLDGEEVKTYRFAVQSLKHGAKFFPYEQIPRSVFAGLEERIAEMKETLKNWPNPDDSGKKPPPPARH